MVVRTPIQLIHVVELAALGVLDDVFTPEHPVDDHTRPARLLQVVVQELLGLLDGPTGRRCDLGQRLARGRQLVLALAADQSERIASLRGGDPRLPHRQGVGLADQLLPCHLLQHTEGGGVAQVLLIAVLHREQLGGPLHVGEPTASELGVQVLIRALGQALGIHARLHAANLADLLGRRPTRRVAELIDHPQKAHAEVLIAGDPGGAQQRLQLPGLAPLGVVALVAGQGAHQRPVAPLRPQVAVHLQRRVLRRLAQAAAHGFTNRDRPLQWIHRLGPTARGVCAAPLLRRTVVIHVSLLDVDVAPPALGALGTVAVLRDGLGDEHDVRVRAIAQLRATQAAHPDHRDRGRGVGLVLILPGPDLRLQGRLQHRIPDPGQGLAHLLHAHQAQQIGGRDAGELRPAQRAGHADRLIRIPLPARRSHQGVRHHRRLLIQQLRPHRPIREQLDRINGVQQQVRQEGRGSQQEHQALAHDVLVTQQAQEPGAIHRRLRELPVGQQPGIRVDRRRQPLQQAGQNDRLQFVLAGRAIGQCAKVLEGTLRAFVTQRSQLALRRLRGQADGVGVHPHHRGEQRAVEQLPVQVLDLQRGLANVQLQLLHQGTLSP